MVLNNAGQVIVKWHYELENKFPDVECDHYIVMPNHFRGIIGITGDSAIHTVGADLCVCPGTEASEHTGSPLHRIVQWFKTMTTNEYIRGVKLDHWPPFPGRLWQRNYYEHVIRNGKELHDIREYIMNNPSKWELDEENRHRR